MNNPMNLINLKMATAVAAVLTVVAIFAPKAAHAQRVVDAPSLIVPAELNFTLNTSDMDSNPDPNIGQYTTGIENLNVTYPLGASPVQASVPSVTLYAFRVDPSQLQPNSDNEIPIPTPLTGFNTDLNTLISGADPYDCNNCINTETYKNGVVVYEAAFVSVSDNDSIDNTLEKGSIIGNKLAFFAPSLGNQSLDSQQLVNSLSGLDRFNQVQGVFSSTASSGDLRTFGFGGPANPYISLGPVEAVPEPADTAGLLAFGAMGAILLLRRNRGIQR